jgi:hypothetical protein
MSIYMSSPDPPYPSQKNAIPMPVSRGGIPMLWKRNKN